MNIVLIGYRGTGKSAVGRQVAERLGMTCVSMDARIVERAGISIPAIVQQHGWSKFRDMETAVARELGQQDHLVIDTGGGVIERPENIPALRANGLVIWLKASVAVIVQRIQFGTERPALTPGKSFTQEVGEVLTRRLPLYQAVAQREIDTDRLTLDQVAEAVITAYRL
ncbi:MAG: shikimate kinase [Desulfatitalea sp.]|nr:shikimate kinase [Desulfatitalea sp.]NNK00084.1 shikimate kinase [Desulfatitalea sp.]